MEYAVGTKKHVYDLLYPFAAKLLGLKSLYLNDDRNFSVRYYGNKYCTEKDDANNAIRKITVECDFGRLGKLYFMPYPIKDGTGKYGYRAYRFDEMVADITPVEWEVIRPKVYSGFSEYLSEFSAAVSAYGEIAMSKDYTPFIRNHYETFFEIFRATTYEAVPTLKGTGLNESVSLLFSRPDVYGRFSKEHAVIMKTLDDRMILHVASLN